jgi:hypothetical protein
VQPIAAARPAAPGLPPAPQTAAHGAEIVALAVTSDGTAAASADRLGGIRLWPTLDGTREPVVIHGTATRAIALARDGDGFALTTLDDAGGVHIMRTSAAGAVRERLTVAGDQRALEIHSTPDGLLVLRADQTVQLVDGAGRIRTRLAPDPGVHIAAIVVRGRRVLALVQDGKRLRGQWIELGDDMHWGAATPSFTTKVAHAVLSPDGALLAITRPRSLHPRLLDLATGAPRKTPLCVPREWPGDGGDSARELLRTDNTPTPLAFVSATVVACSVSGALQWWNTDGTPHQSYAGTFSIGASPVAAADRAVIIGLGASLGIASETANKFLGYGVRDVVQLRAAGTGALVAGGSQQALLLDAALRERARFEQGLSQFDWSDALLIDERYAILAMLRRNYERGHTYQLAVFDGVARVQHQLLPYELRDRSLSYEPSTGLLAVAGAGPGPLLLRLDPATHEFGKPIAIASWIPPSRIAVVDPAQSGGAAALVLDNTSDGVVVAELTLADLQPGATVAPRTSYRVPGELRAADRAGRLYMDGPTEETTVYHRGALVARLPALAGMALYPSADGSHIAAFQSPRLVLLTATGHVRWETALWNSADITWTASGDLLVRSPSGIARIDLATGSLVARRCGWAFGIADSPFEMGQQGPSLCEFAR